MDSKTNRHAKTRPGNAARAQARMLSRPARPRGMQFMGTALYEQIRQVVRELDGARPPPKQ